MILFNEYNFSFKKIKQFVINQNVENPFFKWTKSEKCYKPKCRKSHFKNSNSEKTY